MLEARFGVGQFLVPLHQLNLTGDDVSSFLMSQTTFDTRSLPEHGFHLVSLLDPQGRVESYGWLLRQGAKYSFLLPPILKQPTLERLERFLISEDVLIEELGLKSWLVTLGPRAADVSRGFAGEIFSEQAFLEESSLRPDLPELGPQEIELWRDLSGWVSFDGSDYSHELINNLRLFDLSVSTSKGCYPGQETVSKIFTRRGAAFYPVVIEADSPQGAGPVSIQGRKVGELIKHFEWQGKHYHAAKLIRDFRVAGMRVILSHTSGQSFQGTVRYYPLLTQGAHARAQELFFEASEEFTRGNEERAKELLEISISIDPTFADAYESLGVILGRQQKFTEALEHLKKLSEVDPQSVLAHTNMSLYLMKLGRIEEAEEQKSLAAIKSFQKFGAEADQQEKLEADAIAKRSEWQQRESMFLQVLEIDEHDTLANYGIGSLAVENQEWERAKSHLEKVIAADATYSVAYLALGKAYLGLKLRDAAKEIFTKGISVAAKKGDLMPANQMQLELDHL